MHMVNIIIVVLFRRISLNDWISFLRGGYGNSRALKPVCECFYT